MHIRDDIRQLKTGPPELRKFGLVVGAVFAALGLFFLLRHKAHWPYFLWPGAALIVLGTIYFLQGLAVIACFLDKWRWPPVFRTLAYGLVFIQQPLSLGVALLGLFDLWFDFRR